MRRANLFVISGLPMLIASGVFCHAQGGAPRFGPSELPSSAPGPGAPPEKARPPTPPQPKKEETRASPGCPVNAYELGLQKYAIESNPSELYDSERLLICAMQQGQPKARSGLARLYVKMARTLTNTLDGARPFYSKACDLGDSEACDKLKEHL